MEKKITNMELREEKITKMNEQMESELKEKVTELNSLK